MELSRTSILPPLQDFIRNSPGPLLTRWSVILLILLGWGIGAGGICRGEEASGSLNVDYLGVVQNVTYTLYVPPGTGQEKIPVVVCVGGLPMEGTKYLPSDPAECSDAAWKNFAGEERIAILGLGFLFKPEDWSAKRSYQYPAAWSGRALLKIFKMLSRQYPLDSDELYLFGISAGAQFSIRFARMRPQICRAVAAHAAGGYDPPEDRIPTRFLLTVGELDNQQITRREMAEQFAGAARAKGIDIELKIIPQIGHRQTEEQNQMSREFFREILNKKWTANESPDN